MAFRLSENAVRTEGSAAAERFKLDAGIALCKRPACNPRITGTAAYDGRYKPCNPRRAGNGHLLNMSGLGVGMSRPSAGGALRALLAVIVIVLATTPAEAQYFGRQKVQYEDFDWQVLRADHFDIYHYPGTETITRDAARMSERWYTRLSFGFQHEFDRKPLIFDADRPDFQQTNVIGGALSEGTGGVTESLKNRVIMPWTGVYAENDHVLGHELVHVFQYDIAQTGPTGLSGL